MSGWCFSSASAEETCSVEVGQNVEFLPSCQVGWRQLLRKQVCFGGLSALVSITMTFYAPALSPSNLPLPSLCPSDLPKVCSYPFWPFFNLFCSSLTFFVHAMCHCYLSICTDPNSPLCTGWLYFSDQHCTCSGTLWHFLGLLWFHLILFQGLLCNPKTFVQLLWLLLAFCVPVISLSDLCCACFVSSDILNDGSVSLWPSTFLLCPSLTFCVPGLTPSDLLYSCCDTLWPSVISVCTLL